MGGCWVLGGACSWLWQRRQRQQQWTQSSLYCILATKLLGSRRSFQSVSFFALSDFQQNGFCVSLTTSKQISLKWTMFFSLAEMDVFGLSCCFMYNFALLDFRLMKLSPPAERGSQRSNILRTANRIIFSLNFHQYACQITILATILSLNCISSSINTQTSNEIYIVRKTSAWSIWRESQCRHFSIRKQSSSPNLLAELSKVARQLHSRLWVRFGKSDA